MTAEASTGVSQGRVGRYVLEDLVVRHPESQVWRASDPALQRAVGVRLIPLSDPRIPAITAAARAAAGVHDRRVVQVLDVVETRRHLAIVTEWVQGRPWSEVLGKEDEGPASAPVVAYEVALALQAAHGFGVTHGRLRPNSVIISDTNEVRLRGLGVDAALYGVAPGTDPRAADLHGVGAILYAGLTGRWPDPQAQGQVVDGVQVAGMVNGHLLAPSEISASVPQELSSLASACLLPAVRPKTRKRIPDVDDAAAALAKAIKHSPQARPAKPAQDLAQPTRTDRAIRRIASVVIIGITIAAAIVFTGSLRQGSVLPDREAASAPEPSVAESGAAAATPKPLAIAASSDFDPQGGDGQENPDLVPLATDGDMETAWKTVRYKRSSMNPKSGTGLVLDLGLNRPISAVQVNFYGTGTDFEIRVSDEEGERASDYELLAGAVAAGEDITMRVPIPVETRYVLVWLTNLPYQEGTYIGGIREVKVLG